MIANLLHYNVTDSGRARPRKAAQGRMEARLTPFSVPRGGCQGDARGGTWAAVLALAAALSATLPALAEAPRVVVTIKPVHALVAAVMAGVGRPGLLIEGAASPHGYALRPSDARALSAADLVIWVGPELERFLERPLASWAAGARVVTLLEAPGLELLASGQAPEEAGQAGRHDPHIWLDPDNAAAIAAAAAAALSGLDPANRAALTARIFALDSELRDQLAALSRVPFLVAHDGYRYFTRHFGLNGVAALAPLPGRPPGARRLAELGRLIERLGVSCLLGEPQFEPAVAKTLIRDRGLRTATLDALGAALAAGPEAWFELMRANSRALIACLGGSG